MGDNQKIDKEKVIEKLAKILVAIFFMVLSIHVLSVKVPEMEYIQNSIESLDKSKNTVMVFSGSTLAASTAISLLPDDKASPLANTLAEMNKYFIFIFAILFLERLVVIEGTKIAFVYIIPAACGLYILFVLLQKDKIKEWATKLLILGIALVCVIPFSTHFTETVGSDYLAYIDETIAEANAGADKILDAKAENEDETTLWNKISDAFQSAVQGVADLFTYFNNLIKKCMNSIAIMLVTTFGIPLFILMIFKWLLKELFSLNLNISAPRIRVMHITRRKNEKTELTNDVETIEAVKEIEK